MTVSPDSEKEKKFRDRAVQTARSKAANSVRIISGGGLASALANEAIASDIGMEIAIEPETSLEALMFSEGGARAIYAVQPDKAHAFENIWKGFPIRCIGRIYGKVFEWNGKFSIPLDDIKTAFSCGANRDK